MPEEGGEEGAPDTPWQPEAAVGAKRGGRPLALALAAQQGAIPGRRGPGLPAGVRRHP